MAFDIVQDSTVKGSSVVWDFDGVAMTRHIVLKGCRTSGKNPRKMLWEALLNYGFVPGTTHEDDAAWMVWTVQADPLAGNDKLSITIRYRLVDYVQVRLDGNVIRENTSLDAEGNLLKVDFTKGSQTMPACVTEAEVFRPGAVLEFDRFEKRGDVKTYDKIFPNGSINSRPWQGAPAYTWMLSARKTNTFFRMMDMFGGRAMAWAPTYIPVRYSFQFYGWPRLGKTTIWSDWRKIIMYKNWTLRQVQPNIDTSGIGSGATSGNGWKRVVLQYQKNFDEFNLPTVGW